MAVSPAALAPRQRGRVTTVQITLTPDERAVLEHWVRSTQTPWGKVRRARLLLLVAQGMPIRRAARQAGLTRRHAYIWLARWQTGGLDALEDRPGGRRPRDDA
jgi:hypothetical protein